MLLFAIMAAMLIVRFRRNEPGERTANLHLLALAILSVLSFYHIWHWTHEFRIIQTGSLIHVLWAFVMFKAFSAARRWMRLRGPLPAAALGLAGTAVLALQVHLVVFSFTTNTISPFDVGAISLRTGVHHPIEGTDRSGILPPIHTAIAHSHILKYIGDNTAPDDTLYCFGESILYFLSGRKNATEFDNGRIPAYFPGQREKFIRQLWGRKPKLIIVRDFEWSWWSSKMPEIFEAIQRDYYLEGDLFNFYVFSRVSDLDADIRRANRHFWKGEVTEAAAAYWASLQKNRDHPEVKKILSRFFFSRDLAERSLPVLESYAFRKDGDAWRLRWGTRGRRRFTGKIFGAGAGGGAKLFSGVNVFPRDDGSLRWSVGPGGVLSFVSDLREGAAGLDITVSDPSLMSSFRFELFVDGEPAALVFLFWRGLIPSGEVAINAPSL
ncbi:MAG: hypothetical protein A2Y86_04200 [Candidatus Aminicenantes bacterium RBG_13_62_12]|nr:MAG: hypothetical protein A2Y86_04200 [Candidatus Aminicenantes bacterium RBG_13_62_12]